VTRGGLFARLVLAPLLALGVALPAGAAPPSTLDEVRAEGVLRVGLPGDYAPFAVVDADATDPSGENWRGLDIDVTRAMAAALAVRVVFVRTSWPTLMADLGAGKFDLGAGGITITPDRAAHAMFSDAIVDDGKTPITRCADTTRFVSLAAIDRPGIRVITNPGGTNESFDRAHLHAATIVVFPDNRGIFAALAAGAADLMITDATEARYQQRHTPGLCAVHPDHPFSASEKAYLLPPDDHAWREWVDRFLAQARASGALTRWRQAWLGE
jgi:cyclohexadienyl dehydratase